MTYTQVFDHLQNQISDSVIVRDSDQAFIPMDMDNVDCQEYVAWLDEGHQPNPPAAQPIEPSPPPPDIVDVHAQVQDIEERLNVLEDKIYR